MVAFQEELGSKEVFTSLEGTMGSKWGLGAIMVVMAIKGIMGATSTLLDRDWCQIWAIMAP